MTRALTRFLWIYENHSPELLLAAHGAVRPFGLWSPMADDAADWLCASHRGTVLRSVRGPRVDEHGLRDASPAAR